MFQPDMAAIVLSNQDATLLDAQDRRRRSRSRSATTQASRSTRARSSGSSRSTGRRQDASSSIRAMNKLHRLLRKRKSITFMDKTDQQILSAGRWRRGPLRSSGSTTSRSRTSTSTSTTRRTWSSSACARRAWAVTCGASTESCSSSSPICRRVEIVERCKQSESQRRGRSSGSVRGSRPPAIVKKVTVKGWNPETKELITGEATAQNSQLGSQNAVAAFGRSARGETFTVDHPIWSKEEADALAKARLCRALAVVHHRRGRGARAIPTLDLGKIIEITANAERHQATIRSTASTTSWASPTATRRVEARTAATSRPFASRATRRRT